MSTRQDQLPLRDLLGVLWLRKWWIVGCAVVFALIWYVRADLQPRSYTSTAGVLVLPVNVPEAGITSPGFVFMANEVQIAGSAAVAEIAAEKLASTDVELAGVSITSPPDTQTIDFVARGSYPRSAAESAQAYADAYLEFREDNLLSSIRTQIKSIDALLVDLEDRLADARRELTQATSDADQQALTIEIASLSSQIQEQQQRRNTLELASETPVGQVLQPAYLPSFPSSPRPRRSLFLGALIGLLLGVGVAFLRDRLDQRIRGREDIESTVHAPVLGRIPNAPSLHRHIAVTPGGDVGAAEAFRSLRTRVLFATREGSSTIMVTSPMLGEGKTTVATNLAVAMAQTDVDVILVSADLRRPAVHRYFPQCVGRGLADVLNDGDEVGEVVVGTSQPHLVLVPSGTSSLSPEAGLGTNVMLNTLATLAQEAKAVVLDAPPVLGVSDTLDLASLVDHVILVVDASRARKDVILESLSELQSVGASVLGVVLTHFEAERFASYAGDYRYAVPAEPEPDTAHDEAPIEELLPANGDRDDPGRPVPARRDARTGSGSSDG